jgi:hypothetical protein
VSLVYGDFITHCAILYADRIYILAIENLENAQILYALLYALPHEFCHRKSEKPLSDIIAKMELMLGIEPNIAHLEQVEFPLGRTCLCINLLNILNIYMLCVYFYITNRIFVTAYISAYAAAYRICVMQDLSARIFKSAFYNLVHNAYGSNFKIYP